MSSTSQVGKMSVICKELVCTCFRKNSLPLYHRRQLHNGFATRKGQAKPSSDGQAVPFNCYIQGSIPWVSKLEDYLSKYQIGWLSQVSDTYLHFHHYYRPHTSIEDVQTVHQYKLCILWVSLCWYNIYASTPDYLLENRKIDLTFIFWNPWKW